MPRTERRQPTMTSEIFQSWCVRVFPLEEGSYACDDCCAYRHACRESRHYDVKRSLEKETLHQTPIHDDASTPKPPKTNSLSQYDDVSDEEHREVILTNSDLWFPNI